MASIQEAIGGPQVPEIYGNEWKLRIICWFRGEQQHKDPVDRACDKLWENDRLEEQQKKQRQIEQEAVDKLNEVIKICENMLDNPPEDEEALANEVERCDNFISQVSAIENPSTGEVKTTLPLRIGDIGRLDIGYSPFYIVRQIPTSLSDAQAVCGIASMALASVDDLREPQEYHLYTQRIYT
ncbi:hypothetical protein HRG_007765 [Hirsutella rhossiliensis]|uniref:Uncharacterized protein n=1 Tax=Hirsutella rhossiliensis TaxID=111463 RepID=A0A9P8MVB1_9HYPO|nr:uncharacterized protein HRG_07765 [Hirsutella rhossiliensis]KAH0961687.1 hypothetical protein HRG_07765 [Hirsutella rhossiliensis]